jgi:CHAT domain-containing protein
VGNPTLDLVHADNEARQVAGFFGVSPFLGSRASKATLLPWLADADVIHLACHGKFDPDQPMQSGVVFAREETWTAREIMGQRLQARLVVLSACETGQSEVDRGDELVGLTRAFLHAGALSVIVSLWEVQDASTAALMTDFYQRLMDRDGRRLKPVAVALKEAMLAFKETRGTSDLWAPFILVGEGR